MLIVITAAARLAANFRKRKENDRKAQASLRQDAARQIIGEVLGVEPSMVTDDLPLADHSYKIALRLVSEIQIPINPDVQTVGDVMKIVADWED